MCGGSHLKLQWKKSLNNKCRFQTYGLAFVLSPSSWGGSIEGFGRVRSNPLNYKKMRHFNSLTWLNNAFWKKIQGEDVTSLLVSVPSPCYPNVLLDQMPSGPARQGTAFNSVAVCEPPSLRPLLKSDPQSYEITLKMLQCTTFLSVDRDMQPWLIVPFFDIGPPWYGQLTLVKMRYPLTSILCPYRSSQFMRSQILS